MNEYSFTLKRSTYVSQKPHEPEQQAVNARRTHILDAATKVFAEKGFSRTTIHDIAVEAGIADGTIYNYFENKNALLLGLLDRLNETAQRREHFDQVGELDLTTFVQFYVKHRFERLDADGLSLLQVLIAEVLINPALRDMYYRQIIEPTFTLSEKYFAQWAAEGTIAPINSHLVPRAMAGMVLGMVMLRLMGDDDLLTHWHEVPDVVATLFLHGLLPQAGA